MVSEGKWKSRGLDGGLNGDGQEMKLEEMYPGRPKWTSGDFVYCAGLNMQLIFIILMVHMYTIDNKLQISIFG